MKKKLISNILVAIISVTFLESGIAANAETIITEELIDQNKEWEKTGIEENPDVGLNMFGKERLERYGRGENIDKFTLNTTVDLTEKVGDVSDDRLPSKIDNSDLKFFPVIGDQGRIGSCSSYASTYYLMSYMTNMVMNREGRTEDGQLLAENTFSPRWTYSMVNKGADNGSFVERNLYAIRDIGVLPIKDFKFEFNNLPIDYKEWNMDTELERKAQKYSISKLYNIRFLNTSNITKEDLCRLKKMLLDGYNFTFSKDAGCYMNTVCITTEEKGNKVYQSNLSYTNDKGLIGLTPSDSLGHAMSIVGYDDNVWVDINQDKEVQDSEKGGLKIANSWGGNGFIWLPYSLINETIINGGLQTIIPEVKSDKGIYAYVTLNSSDRSKSNCSILAREIKTAKTYKFTPWNLGGGDPYIGSCGFDGTVDNSDKTFVVDLNRVVPGITSDTLKDYSWSISDSGKNILKEFKIKDEITGNEYSKYFDFMNVNPSDYSKDSACITINTSNTSLINNISVKAVTIGENYGYEGDDVRIIPNVEGGSGNYYYEFNVKKDGEVVAEGASDDADSLVWSNAQKGSNYSVILRVTDKKTKEVRVCTNENLINIYNAISIEDLTVKDVETNKKAEIVLNINNPNPWGKDRGKLYKVTEDGEELVKEFVNLSNRLTYAFIPYEAGEYLYRFKAIIDGKEFIKDFKLTASKTTAEVPDAPRNVVQDGVSSYSCDKVDDDNFNRMYAYYNVVNGELIGIGVFADRSTGRVNLNYKTGYDNDEYVVAYNKRTQTFSAPSEVVSYKENKDNNQSYMEMKLNGINSENFNPEIIGKTINLKPDITGGSANKSYTYTIYNTTNSSSVSYEGSDDGSLSWKPEESDLYIVSLKVRDNETNEEQSVRMNYKINEPLNFNSFTCTKTGFQENFYPFEKMILNSQVTGGAGNLTFTYRVISPEKRCIAVQEGRSSAVWIIPKEGNFTLEAEVTDSEGNSVKKNSNVTAVDIGLTITTPQNLRAEYEDNGKVKLMWDESTTNFFGVKGYEIFCGEEQIGSTTTTEFEVTPKDSLDHYYYVRSYGTTGICSEKAKIFINYLPVVKAYINDNLLKVIGNPVVKCGEKLRFTTNIIGIDKPYKYEVLCENSDGKLCSIISKNDDMEFEWQFEEKGDYILYYYVYNKNDVGNCLIKKEYLIRVI